MKKIIATVLAMVMALALCSTAFAAADVTVTAKAVMPTNGKTVYYTVQNDTVKDITLTLKTAAAPKLNSDNQQTNKANVAYYVVPAVGTFTGGNYVVASSLADADLVVYSTCTKDGTASGILYYLAKTDAFYEGTGTVFTNFGTKCGQVNLSGYDKTETYYTSNGVNQKGIYMANDEGAITLMVNGKLVKVSEVAVNKADITVKHAPIPTVENNKVVGYTCSICGTKAIKAPNYASIPDGAQIIPNTNWYFPAAAAASTTTTTSSPKTFDAGIAMYVGMALTSVAGSAVVIGKKKEF